MEIIQLIKTYPRLRPSPSDLKSASYPTENNIFHNFHIKLRKFKKY